MDVRGVMLQPLFYYRTTTKLSRCFVRRCAPALRPATHRRVWNNLIGLKPGILNPRLIPSMQY